TAVLTVATIIMGGVHNPVYMVYILAGWFGVIGNAWIMAQVMGKKPRMIGGTLTHVGFMIMLLGFMGAAFDRPMLDQDTREYNEAVLQGQVKDSDGFPVV